MHHMAETVFHIAPGGPPGRSPTPKVAPELVPRANDPRSPQQHIEPDPFSRVLWPTSATTRPKTAQDPGRPGRIIKTSRYSHIDPWCPAAPHFGMVSRAPGAAQTPKIVDLRPAPKSCIKIYKCTKIGRIGKHCVRRVVV